MNTDKPVRFACTQCRKDHEVEHAMFHYWGPELRHRCECGAEHHVTDEGRVTLRSASEQERLMFEAREHLMEMFRKEEERRQKSIFFFFALPALALTIWWVLYTIASN